ncbi:MAG TPA: excinuclease ABC subunit UvrC [Bacteriovoracaceae bacterium]|nr:excinuclease ABC subunit UvrC [Bacteriovoracaceae bacterium]
MNKLDELLDKASKLPAAPGCYLMKDKKDQVIYVGKAKKLKARVSSYFNNSAKSVKTEFMVSHIDHFDFMVTSSEAESFILENNLIKEHTPKYNIRLRDDKSYPYLQINYNEPFPRLEYVRRPKKEKGKQFYGPFPPGIALTNILRILTKTFALRDCSLNEFKSRKTPCLLYQMKQCSAPCVGLIDSKDYEESLNLALSFFQGASKARRTLKIIEKRMMDCAEREEFEQAAILRDNYLTLNEFLEKSVSQKVESLESDKNLDLWSYWEGYEEVDISVYMIRSGLLLGHKNFNFVKSEFIEDMEEEITQKILQYYSAPDEILPTMAVIDFPEENLSVMAEALQTFGDIKIVGRSKKYQALLDMCKKHAHDTQQVRLENADSVYQGLNKLKDLLKLKERPKILECYDIAIWQGKSPTASQIVFEEGVPDKTKYRHYHLKELPEGNNDFAMMREVISRRADNGKLPDVFVIDGGIAQVNTVIQVLKDLKIHIPVVGIAKSRDLTRGNYKAEPNSRSEERLIIPGRSNPYILSKCPALFKMMVFMRDEAHRFSRRLHHKAESKRVMNTWLDEVEGIGEETKMKILKQLTLSKEELREFNVGDLINYFGIKAHHAKAIYNHLHGEKNAT